MLFTRLVVKVESSNVTKDRYRGILNKCRKMLPLNIKDHAEDLAQYIAMNIIQGRDVNLHWQMIDYLRIYFKGSNSRIKSNIDKDRIDYSGSKIGPIFVPLEEALDKTCNDYGKENFELEYDLNRMFNEDEDMNLLEFYKNEFSGIDIAKHYGVSAGRISQKTSRLKKVLRAYSLDKINE